MELTLEERIQKRIDKLHPSKQAIMADFGYLHLTRDDLKQTSKILHDAMLELCEILPDVDDVKAIANKIWEGKNLAVHLMVKG